MATKIKQYTSKQLAECLGVSLQTVRKALNAGELEYILIGKSKRVTEEQLQRYLKRGAK